MAGNSKVGRVLLGRHQPVIDEREQAFNGDRGVAAIEALKETARYAQRGFASSCKQ